MERFGLMQRRLRALNAPRPLIALALVALTTLLLSWPLHLARGLYGSGDFSYAVDVAASLVILIFAGVVVQAWIEQADEERSEWIARLSYRSLKAWLLNARNELRVYDHGYDPRDWGGPCNADRVERMKHLLSTLGIDAASDAATRAARLRELSTHRRWLIDTWYGVKDLKVRGRDEVARFAPAMLRAKRSTRDLGFAALLNEYLWELQVALSRFEHSTVPGAEHARTDPRWVGRVREDDPAEYLVRVWDNLLTLGVALEEHLSTLGGHAATFEHEDRDLLTPAGAKFVAGLAKLSDREWTRRFQHELVESGVERDEGATHV